MCATPATLPVEGRLPQNFSGRLDRIVDGVLEGWALHPEDEEECQLLEVLIDGVFVGQVKAGLYREDLAQASLRGGYAKFLYYVPTRFIDGRSHSIDLRHAGTAQSIDNMPTSFTIGVKASVQLAERRTWALQTLVLRDETLEDGFADAIRAAKRVAFVSTYHNANSFMLYQRTLFHSLADAGFVVVVVHASTVYDERMDTTTGPGCYTIMKRNIGYDFGSWAVGAFAIDALLDEVDEILLVNDSVIELESGVLGTLVARARATGADAVGATESYERQYHLQSYFIWLGPRLCRSSLLRAFMAGLSFSSDKETVIKEGELALTARIAGDGFRIACLTPYEQVAQRWLDSLDRIVGEIRSLPSVPSRTGNDAYKTGLLERLDQIVALVIDGTPVNPGHFFWDALIESCDCRLLKRELVILNPCRVPTHYRLGALLTERPAARRAILDLRQRYGGALIPAFWTGSDQEPPVLTRRQRAAVAAVTLPPSTRTVPSAIAWNTQGPAAPALATDWPDTV
jgi:hypothetical protein